MSGQGIRLVYGSELGGSIWHEDRIQMIIERRKYTWFSLSN